MGSSYSPPGGGGGGATSQQVEAAVPTRLRRFLGLLVVDRWQQLDRHRHQEHLRAPWLHGHGDGIRVHRLDDRESVLLRAGVHQWRRHQSRGHQRRHHAHEHDDLPGWPIRDIGPSAYRLGRDAHLPQQFRGERNGHLRRPRVRSRHQRVPHGQDGSETILNVVNAADDVSWTQSGVLPVYLVRYAGSWIAPALRVGV